MRPSRLLRTLGTQSLISLRGLKSIPNDFRIYRDFLSLAEQRILLTAILNKLDSLEPPRTRKRRRRLLAQRPIVSSNGSDIADLFAPDEYYEFEKGHYDGVIRNYRETAVTTWETSPSDPGEEMLLNTIQKIQALLAPSSPAEGMQTHALHLSSKGEILAHVDNVEASGPHILGVSLGATRIMRMEGEEAGSDLGFDVLLPSGTVYVQSHSIRYDYRHSILKQGVFQGQAISGGQRVSLMIRDSLVM